MIFISHKHDPDHEIALKIAEELKNNGINVWIAPESIAAGKDFSEEIPPAINACEIFLLILTEHTALSSHTRKEVMMAINHHKTVIPLKIGEFDLDDSFDYLLSDIQCTPFAFSDQDIQNIVDRCKMGERKVEMELSKNPGRCLTLIKGDFQENMDYMIQEKPEELQHTFFAIGMDCSARLDISSNEGILKWVCAYLLENYGITLDDLQKLVDKARTSQLEQSPAVQGIDFKDIVTIEVPIRQQEKQYHLNFMLIGNSRKKESFYTTHNVDEVEGIDSREIIISIFNKCQEMGAAVKNLFIGAMGTNGLEFPYEVVTSEILNCYVYAMRRKAAPYNLYYSVRQKDMERAGLSVEDILSYITMVVSFFRD